MRAVYGLFIVALVLMGCRALQKASPQESLLQQGAQKVETKDYAEAEKLFHEYVKQSSSLTSALKEVFRVYYQYRAFEPAYQFLIQYEPRSSEIRVEIDRADFYRALGDLAFFSNRREESLRWYAKAVELDPQNHLALNNYAYALAEMNRELDKALNMAKRAVAIKTGQGAYHDTLAWVYFKLGQYEEALKNIRIAVQTAPDSAELRYHYAEILAKVGRREDALVELEKALTMQPGHEHARKLRQQLQGEPKS